MHYARIAWEMLRNTWTEFSNDKAMRLAAALAFYTALSIAPLLLIVVSIAGMVFGEEAARGELLGQLKQMIGPEQAEALNSMLASSQPKDGGLVAGLIGIGTLIVGATGVFAQLQDSLNAVWNVDPQKTSAGGLWGMIRDRLLSFSMVCGMAFLLLVSLVLSAVLHAVNGMMAHWWPEAATALSWGNMALSWLLTFVMFALIFKVLPHVRLAWSDVAIGAAITTVLFEAGRYLIGLYIGKAAPGSTFGAAGSFVVLLLWLYYSSVILLFGAEFTQVYATRQKSVPDTHAAKSQLTDDRVSQPPAGATAFGIAPG
jgi:membrane protein